MTIPHPNLLAIALEFFWGEAVYEMDLQLENLRKWRLITVSIPLIGLIMIFTCGILWPYTPSSMTSEQIQTLGRLEYKVETLDKHYDEMAIRFEKLSVEGNLRALNILELKNQVEVIRQQLNLVGWLMGGAALALAGQTFAYFYQLRLRKTLRGIEKRGSIED